MQSRNQASIHVCIYHHFQTHISAKLSFITCHSANMAHLADMTMLWTAPGTHLPKGLWAHCWNLPKILLHVALILCLIV